MESAAIFKLKQTLSHLFASLRSSNISTASARQKAYQRGLWGEGVALWFMRLKGYQIVARRLKTPFGEIDLLMRRGKTIIAVEVKTRAHPTQGLDALTPRSQGRLKRALEYSLTRWPQYGCFDLNIHLIVVCPWRFPLHLPNL